MSPDSPCYVKYAILSLFRTGLARYVPPRLSQPRSSLTCASRGVNVGGHPPSHRTSEEGSSGPIIFKVKIVTPACMVVRLRNARGQAGGGWWPSKEEKAHSHVDGQAWVVEGKVFTQPSAR